MNRHEEALIYALNVLKKPEYKKFITSIYLYGSCARCTQSYASDVDLFLFVSNDISYMEIAKMRSDVNSGNASLPTVDLQFSNNTFKFSECQQFNKNLEKEAILLWKQTAI